ncbi:uncharacterized protein LOC111376349 [Olea europaea var. sylvestris]|uniref:uncharacterized protein LOC111376349 n=1 Tax=Olea europaea var. sylvestris TaxID=158386 RepID=UPI000C1CDD58|nr:uncharacterized protein LOC111376349 [Olea europaea var. sylvestris]
MTKSIYQSLALTFLSFLLLSPSSAHDKKLPDVDFKGSFSTVYAFGDSYTDTGNAKFLGGFNASVDAKNIPLEKLKSLALGTVEALGGNPTGRLCNGKLVTLLAAGAKYIVVQGLPPVGCLPMDISLCPLQNLNKMGCAAAVNSAIMIHNQILQRNIENLRKINPNSTIVSTRLKNPLKHAVDVVKVGRL